jgi:phosphatidate cytidylyltransferase
MIEFWQSVVLLVITGISLILWIIHKTVGKSDFFVGCYTSFTLAILIAILFSYYLSFTIAVMILALLSFVTLREYLSLIDVRLQDRLGVLGAYSLIPFLYYFVVTNWYGMFIISVPVYGFLLIPLLIALGGYDTEVTVFSIGAINFGLFLSLYCLGHIAYLLSYSIWMPVILILSLGVSDNVVRLVFKGKRSNVKSVLISYVVTLPLTIGINLIFADWAGIPILHACVLGAILPILAMMGRYAGHFVRKDLTGDDDPAFSGRGQVLDNLRSYFYAAPVMFHYIRYFLK